MRSTEALAQSASEAARIGRLLREAWATVPKAEDGFARWQQLDSRLQSLHGNPARFGARSWWTLLKSRSEVQLADDPVESRRVQLLADG